MCELIDIHYQTDLHNTQLTKQLEKEAEDLNAVKVHCERKFCSHAFKLPSRSVKHICRNSTDQNVQNVHQLSKMNGSCATQNVHKLWTMNGSHCGRLIFSPWSTLYGNERGNEEWRNPALLTCSRSSSCTRDRSSPPWWHTSPAGGRYAPPGPGGGGGWWQRRRKMT